MGRSTQETTKYLTQKDMKKLLDTIETSKSLHAVRDLAIFRVAYRCGLRASEIALIKLEHYNAKKWEIFCQRLKGSKSNTIRLDEKTQIALSRYIEKYNITNTYDVLFKSQEKKPISRQTLDYLMKRYCREAGIEDTTKLFQILKYIFNLQQNNKKKCMINFQRRVKWFSLSAIRLPYIKGSLIIFK